MFFFSFVSPCRDKLSLELVGFGRRKVYGILSVVPPPVYLARQWRSLFWVCLPVVEYWQ